MGVEGVSKGRKCNNLTLSTISKPQKESGYENYIQIKPQIAKLRLLAYLWPICCFCS